MKSCQTGFTKTEANQLAKQNTPEQFPIQQLKEAVKTWYKHSKDINVKECLFYTHTQSKVTLSVNLAYSKQQKENEWILITNKSDSKIIASPPLAHR